MSERVRDRTLVLIEDDPALRRIIEISLERFADWVVYSAGTLAEGIVLGRRETPDFFLVDLMLPDGDGVQILDAMSAGVLCKKPVIVLSALVQSASKREELLLKGAHGVLQKPFDPKSLANVIDGMLCANDGAGP